MAFVLLLRHITFQKYDPFKIPAPLIDMKRRVEVMLIDIPTWERDDNMSFLATVASFLNVKRKILTSKEAEPLIREVVQGILTAFATSKKKVRTRSGNVDVALIAYDSSREMSNIVGADERTLIDLSLDDSKHVSSNSGSDLMDYFHWVVAAKGQLSALKEKVSSLKSEVTKLEEVARGAKSQEGILKKNLLATLKKAPDLVAKEASGVEGYNPNCPNFPPSIGEAPPGESEGREETLVNVTSLQDLL
uniref:Uncharacterized protein n=1 Tax=Cannabis sativa TaxID=3483 RepID=A0A803Q885_CANSA